MNSSVFGVDCDGDGDCSPPTTAAPYTTAAPTTAAPYTTAAPSTTAAPTTTAPSTTDAGPSTTTAAVWEMSDVSLNITCIFNCKQGANINADSEFTFKFDCPTCPELKHYDWSIQICTSGNDGPTCIGTETPYYKNKKSKFFKFKSADAVEFGSTLYKVFIEVSTETTFVSNASYILEYTPTPVEGTCQIAPVSGYALVTQFNVTCSGFSVEGGWTLYYSLLTSVKDNLKKAVTVYSGEVAMTTGLILQTGSKKNNYTLYLAMKASLDNGAFVIHTFSSQVLPPGKSEEKTNVLDVIDSFIAVDDTTGKSVIGDLISGGDVSGATQILGVITSSMNSDTVEKPSEEELKKKKSARTAIVKSLNTMTITDAAQLQSVVSVLNQATSSKTELTEEAEDIAVDVYSTMADNIDTLFNDTSVDITDTLGSILEGTTSILDTKTDKVSAALADAEDTAGVDQKVNKTALKEKTKASTYKILSTVSTVVDAVLARQVSGKNATVIKTESMMISAQKLPSQDLNTATLAADGATNSTATFNFPHTIQGLSGDVGVKMVYMEKNPYIWDDTAQNVTSPVMSVDLKDTNSNDVDVSDLTEPVSVSLTSSELEPLQQSNFSLTIIKSGENTTFDTSKSNMLAFNFTMEPNKTTLLRIVIHSNVTNLKILINTDGVQPELENVTESGFLYPKDIQSVKYANFTIFKEELSAISPAENKNAIFFTHEVSDTAVNVSGTYYVGVTLDLSDNQTLQELMLLEAGCLGAVDVDNCTSEVEVSLDIETKTLACVYWSDVEQIFSGQGCEVTPYTTPDKIQCVCTHLTSFAGSVLVLPNFVDPIGDAALFLTFFENPVVVVTVVMIWVLYFFLIHWARQADKKDLEQVGVIPSESSNPSHTYAYLVCVVTGWWKHAGTTANVFLNIKGRETVCPTQTLNTPARLCFQTGYEDWFLVTTEACLGDLQSVTLWHDNSGNDPHWYVSQVYIKDLQTEESWTFIYNDWLAVDRGSILHTTATIEAVDQSDLKSKQKHNFMVKSTRDLRDGHLWISIFSKHARSTFTRVQRLTCALSMLLTTMLTNIMFYGVPTDDPEDQAGASGTITISLSAIVIGIESSLIMFPINLIILQLFLQIAPKPKKSKKVVVDERRYREYLEHVIQIGRDISDQVMMQVKQGYSLLSKKPPAIRYPMADIASMRKADTAADVWFDAKSNTEMLKQPPVVSFLLPSDQGTKTPDISTMNMPSDTSDTETSANGNVKKKPNSKPLPWWFLYITWVLVITSSVICSYFVMLYGLMYGYTRSVSWLVSFLTGFGQSAFITQPLKVLAIATVVTLIFKKAVEFEDYGPDIELDDDEEYMHSVGDKKEIHQPFVEPLSSRLIAKIRERLHIEWLMDLAIRDIGLYVIYLAVLLFVVHGHRDVKKAYYSSLAIEDVFVNPGCINPNKCFFLEKADTVERFQQYLKDIAIPSLADMAIPEHEYATPGSSHYLLGVYRLRQLRIAQGTCSKSSSTIFSKFDLTLDCVGPYWIGDEDTQHYNGSWQLPLSEKSTELSRWIHQSSWKLKTIPYGGKHATYSGGGYVLEFPAFTSLQQYYGILDDAINNGWIDDRTRAIFLEFTVYNTNANLFSVVTILFEFTNTGGIFPSSEVLSTNLYHYTTDIGALLPICEALFLCFTIVFTHLEVKRYRMLGKQEYFADVWSYVEIVQLALSYTVIGLFFQKTVSIDIAMDLFRESQGTAFVSFYVAIFWDCIFGYVMGFLVAVVILKAAKLLRFNRRVFMIADTMASSKALLVSFVFVMVIFAIGFAHFARICFGGSVSEYRNMGTSMMSVFNFALGVSDFPALQQANSVLGPLFFVIFIFITQWCFMTVFIAILNFAINDSKDMLAKRQNKFELVDYIVGKIKIMLNIK